MGSFFGKNINVKIGCNFFSKFVDLGPIWVFFWPLNEIACRFELLITKNGVDMDAFLKITV